MSRSGLPTFLSLGAILLLLTAVVRAQSAPLPLANGGGESLLATEVDKGRFDVPGWTVELGEWHARMKGWHDVSPVEGDRFLTGGKGGRLVASQEVELPETMRRGRSLAFVRAFVRARRKDEEVRITLGIVDDAGKVVAARDSGTLRPTRWTEIRVGLEIPRGGKRIRVTVEGYRRGAKSLDVCFDGVRLTSDTSADDLVGTNLVRNGGGESSNATVLGLVGRKRRLLHLPGWTADSGSWAAVENGHDRRFAASGRRWIRTEHGGSCELSQDVILPQRKRSGRRILYATGFLRSARGDDDVRLRVELRTNHGELVSRDASPAIRATRWTPVRVAIPIPDAARRARLVLRSVRNGPHNEGHFDEVRVSIESSFPMRGDGVDGHISECLDARDDRTRRRALRTLALGGTARGLKFLRHETVRAKTEARRIPVLEALAAAGRKEDVPRFRKLLEAGPGPMERQVVLHVLSLLPFDWRRYLGRLASRRVSAEEAKEDPKRAARVRGLASAAFLRLLDEGGSQVLEVAEDLWQESDAARIAAMRHLGEAFRLAEIDREFVTRGLDPDAATGLRHEALCVLARERSRRFLRLLPMAAKHDTNLGRRRLWVEWALDYDSVAGIEAALPLIVDAHPSLGRILARKLPELRSPEVEEWLLTEGATSDSRAVRLATVHALRRRAPERVVEVALELCGDRDPEVLAEASSLLIASRDPRVPEILLRLVRHRDERVAARALISYWSHQQGRGGAAAAALEIADRSRNDELRVAALDLLKKKYAGAARSVIRENFDHRNSRVRVAAFDAATWLREIASIDALVARLPREKGSARHHLADCLKDLTGFDWGADAGKWKEWWKRSREGFVLPKKPARRASSQPRRTYARYYGIPVKSRNVVFVLDFSGSMLAKTKTGSTRIKDATAELRRLLETFDESMRFNIVIFDDVSMPWRRKMARSTPANRKKAAAWLDELEPDAGGATNIHDALLMALDFEDVESIFLLSDGEPSFVSPTEIRERVHDYNRLTRVRINTIAVGGLARVRGFMRQLAEENHGSFADA